MVIWHILLPKHTTYYIYRYVYYTSIHLYVYTSNDKEKEIEKEKFNEAKTKACKQTSNGQQGCAG